jgi:hypothetical protein
MMRKYIFRLGLLGMLAAVLIAAGSACKSSTSADDVLAQKSFTSTSSQIHTHEITVLKNEIENPPTSGMTRATSLVNSHQHSFSMSQDQLRSVKNGDRLDIETGVGPGDHSHTFTIQKWW